MKVKAIANLADDIALHLAATSIRMECPIPGKSAVGIELPNKTVTTVRLRDLIANSVFRDSKEKLLVCLGVDIGGNPVYLNIAKMPHLLVAGATGMGKSVCINSMIVSLLYHAKPDEVKLILIDPKKIELSDYNGIPHLLVPVVTEPKKAAGTLNVGRRRDGEAAISSLRRSVRASMSEYNDAIRSDPERRAAPQHRHHHRRAGRPDDGRARRGGGPPSAVIAQMARAAGIHLVIAHAAAVGGRHHRPHQGQRPLAHRLHGRIARSTRAPSSIWPARRSCWAAAICCYAPVGSMKPLRVQGAFVDGKNEVTAVCDFVRKAAGTSSYSEEVMHMIEQEAMLCGEKHSRRGREDAGPDTGAEKDDPMLMQAIEVAFECGTVSTSLLQRRLSLGYSRAARIVDILERRGIVGSFDAATKKRALLLTKEQFLEMKLNASDNKENGHDANE